jgi:hypothetical protein
VEEDVVRDGALVAAARRAAARGGAEAAEAPAAAPGDASAPPATARAFPAPDAWAATEACLPAALDVHSLSLAAARARIAHCLADPALGLILRGDARVDAAAQIDGDEEGFARALAPHAAAAPPGVPLVTPSFGAAVPPPHAGGPLNGAVPALFPLHARGNLIYSTLDALHLFLISHWRSLEMTTEAQASALLDAQLRVPAALELDDAGAGRWIRTRKLEAAIRSLRGRIIAGSVKEGESEASYVAFGGERYAAAAAPRSAPPAAPPIADPSGGGGGGGKPAPPDSGLWRDPLDTILPFELLQGSRRWRFAARSVAPPLHPALSNAALRASSLQLLASLEGPLAALVEGEFALMCAEWTASLDEP